jgi:hypothetical protein
MAIAQQKPVSFAEIDERVKRIAPAPPAALAYTLTKDYSTDREKLRSIFSWIAEHIAYRVKKNRNGANSLTTFAGQPLFTDTGQCKSANDFVAETVLQNQSAVCDGYARLFTTICGYAGLRSAVITGYAKGDLSRQLPFHSNHTWNAVYIDSRWQLLDLTWASGYTNYRGDEFIKRYDESYFLTAPEDFIHDHFPDDLRWTLLDKPPQLREFNNAPYKNRSFGKYSIRAYAPATGIVEGALGDTISFVLETGNREGDSKMAADTIAVFDSSLQKINAAIAFLEPVYTNDKKGRLLYSFCVQSDAVQWIQLLYNHDMILRYRLRISKTKTSLVAAHATAMTFYP